MRTQTKLIAILFVTDLIEDFVRGGVAGVFGGDVSLSSGAVSTRIGGGRWGRCISRVRKGATRPAAVRQRTVRTARGRQV